MIHTIATQPDSSHPLNHCNDLLEDKWYSHLHDYIPCDMIDCGADVEKAGDMCEKCKQYCEDHA